MARTSAKAKKPKQDANKNKAKSSGEKKFVSEQKNEPQHAEENTGNSTDKENDNSNYEVEKILHFRSYHGKRQYLVRWRGYKEDGDTWETESALHSCPEALEAFKKNNPALFEKQRTESDTEEKDESSEDSEKEEGKGKKRSKQETKRVPKKKQKKSIVSSKTEIQKSVEEDADVNDKEGKKDAKGNDKRGKKGATKKLNKKEDGLKKKENNSESDDDESVTDGKNYEVDKIVEVHLKKDGSREFLIRWKGYKPSEDTWEPETHLDCPEIINKFMSRVDKAKSLSIRELRVPRKNSRIISHQKNTGIRTNLRNTGFRPYYQE